MTDNKNRFKLFDSHTATNNMDNQDTHGMLDSLIKNHSVIIFMKGSASAPRCGFSARAVEALQKYTDKLYTVDVLENDSIREGIKEYSNWPTIPQLYINGEFIGGSDIILELDKRGELKQLLS